jgi:hypothetical protein
LNCEANPRDNARVPGWKRDAPAGKRHRRFLSLVPARIRGHGAAAAVLALVASVCLTASPAFGSTRGQASTLDASVLDRINAIRAAFHLAPGEATTSYDAEVLHGVMTNDDPPFAPADNGILAEDSIWGVMPVSATTNPSPLGVVNAWVYEDGWRGSTQTTLNADCTSAGAPGCDGHRRALLSRPPVAGAHLVIDVVTHTVDFDGSAALGVAALLIWEAPS